MQKSLQKKTDWNLSEEKEYEIKLLESTKPFNFRDDFLENDSKKELVIGATFGVGKTSYVKYWTSLLASGQINEADFSEYIPVFVRLKAGFGNVFDGDSLKTVMTNLSEIENLKILLILDGLDEIDDKKEKIDEAKELLDGKQSKLLVTTRLDAGFKFEIFDIVDDEEGPFYVRLLPFTPKQVNDFFANADSSLTYENATKFGLDSRDIRKPLFCSMLIDINSDFEGIAKSLPNNNMIKTILYTEFFKSLYNARPDDRLNISKQRTERNTLRMIAALQKCILHFMKTI